MLRVDGNTRETAAAMLVIYSSLFFVLFLVWVLLVFAIVLSEMSGLLDCEEEGRKGFVVNFARGNRLDA